MINLKKFLLLVTLIPLLFGCTQSIKKTSRITHLGLIVKEPPRYFLSKAFYCEESSCGSPLINKLIGPPVIIYLNDRESRWNPKATASEKAMQTELNQQFNKHYGTHVFEKQVDETLIPALEQCGYSVVKINPANLYYIDSEQEFSIAETIALAGNTGYNATYRLANLPDGLDTVLTLETKWGFQDASPVDNPVLGPYFPSVFVTAEPRNGRGYRNNYELYQYEYKQNPNYTMAKPTADIALAMEGLRAYNRAALIGLAQQLCNE